MAASQNQSPCGPAQVRVGWRGDSLLVFAALTDRDIFTRATAVNQRIWELGDTLEIFLQAVGDPGHFEFHITPNNLQLQLRFPDANAPHEARLPCPVRMGRAAFRRKKTP